MTMSVKEIIEQFYNGEEIGWGIDTAMKSLRPGAKFILTGKAFYEWEDPNGLEPPSWNEVEKECERHRKISEYYKYICDRSKKFPYGHEQLDMLWHDINSGKPLSEGVWFNTIKEIKEKYPKPEGPAPE
jgi:hypothetical protein